MTGRGRSTAPLLPAPGRWDKYLPFNGRTTPALGRLLLLPSLH